MGFEQHDTPSHLRNTNEEILNETGEISVPPLKVYSTKSLLLQNSHRDKQENGGLTVPA